MKNGDTTGFVKNTSAELARKAQPLEQLFPVEEAQQTLQAIRAGHVDAFVIDAGEAPRVLVLEGADYAHQILFGTLNEGAMTVTVDGTILFANQRLAEMLRCPISQLVGQRLGDHVSPDNAGVLSDLLLHAAKGSSKGELRFVSANGNQVPVMLSIRDIGQPNACFTVVATDLTALKAAEAALRSANDELEARVLARTAELSLVNDALRAEITERSRLEEELRNKAEALLDADRRKDEFLSMLAHELRNPLAPILMATEMLRHLSSGNLAIERYRMVIDRQARNLTRLVDDLLDVSRITRGAITLQTKYLDFRSVMQSAIEAARPLIDVCRHELSISLPELPLMTVGDPTRLEQIIVNLLNNAAKYTEVGGKIHISATNSDGQAVVRVRDTGMGMPPDLVPHVFDLFVQGSRSLDRAQGGLGIGLTMAKSLVAMHGGSIEAHSQGIGRGSEFVVRLPLRVRDSSVASGASASATDAFEVGRAKRALVVEDNADAAEMLKELLELWSYEVRSVGNGEDAVAMARSFRPDVVLLDIGLPGMDGFEVARRLRGCLPGAMRPLVIGVSGYGQDADRRKARDAGIDHHLVKPLDPQVLKQILAHDEASPRFVNGGS